MIIQQEVTSMFEPKYKLSHDEVRIIVYALVELKNQLIEEGRYLPRDHRKTDQTHAEGNKDAGARRPKAEANGKG